MEEKKKSNVGLIILVVILLIVCVGMGAFIIINKGKLMSNEKTVTTVEDENKDTDNNTETADTKNNGECPLTKFDNNYVLTDTDKEEIIISLESLNAGFTKQNIDINTFTISSVASSGYYMNVKFDMNPNTSGTYASVAKVNNKFKVLAAGSGDTVDGVERMENTLERICK